VIRAAVLEHPGVSVRALCELLGVDRSWYYDRPGEVPASMVDADLRDGIERVVLEYLGYGYRRVTKQLQRDGWEVNHKRVLRVMREETLLCQLKRRFVVTTDSRHGLRTYPNLMGALALSGLDEAWVADITYVRLPAAFVYLACVLDGFSRRCVGWALNSLFGTSIATLIQTNAQGRLRGRAMSVYTITVIGIPSFGAMGTATIAEAVGARNAVGFAAAALAVVTIALFLSSRQLREAG